MIRSTKQHQNYARRLVHILSNYVMPSWSLILCCLLRLLRIGLITTPMITREKFESYNCYITTNRRLTEILIIENSHYYCLRVEYVSSFLARYLLLLLFPLKVSLIRFWLCFQPHLKYHSCQSSVASGLAHIPWKNIVEVEMENHHGNAIWIDCS